MSFRRGTRFSEVERVSFLLHGCKSVLVITGAGVSADSGLPTYRGVGGLYDGGKPTAEGIPVEDALSGEMLRKRPEVTWKYLLQIERNCRNARFNRAHEVIAAMERRFERVWVLTQNIDGFHQAAGSRNVIDIHGDLHRLICVRCGRRSTVPDYRRLEMPPKCPECAGPIRPEVVFFGEMLPEDKVGLLQRELLWGFDIYFSVGTSSVFPYIQQPMLLAKQMERPSVEINPEVTPISGLVDIKLRLRAAEALESIWREYLRIESKNNDKSA